MKICIIWLILIGGPLYIMLLSMGAYFGKIFAIQLLLKNKKEKE
jgi:hypothetical protein